MVHAAFQIVTVKTSVKPWIFLAQRLNNKWCQLPFFDLTILPISLWARTQEFIAPIQQETIMRRMSCQHLKWSWMHFGHFRGARYIVIFRGWFISGCGLYKEETKEDVGLCTFFLSSFLPFSFLSFFLSSGNWVKKIWIFYEIFIKN